MLSNTFFLDMKCNKTVNAKYFCMKEEKQNHHVLNLVLNGSNEQQIFGSNIYGSSESAWIILVDD